MSEFQTEAPEEVATEATEDTSIGKTVIRPDTTEYKRAKSASGAMSQHNGDIVASRIVGFSVEQVAGVLAIMIPDTTVHGIMTKYAHLNVGQQRMAVGNRLRGALNKANKAYVAYVAALDEGEDILMKHGEEIFISATQATRDELDAAAELAEKEAEAALEAAVAAKEAKAAEAAEAAEAKANIAKERDEAEAA